MDLLDKTLGTYRIDRRLGEGNIGVVYQAYNLLTERTVAIKVIHDRFARQPSFRDNFPRELSIATALDDPGIIKVLDFGQHQTHLYIVMEYIRGANLRRLLDELILQREWVSLNDAARMVEHLCQTMEYAHQHDSHYWDLNPANIMIRPQPDDSLSFRPVLIDLQLARLVETLEEQQEEVVLGTPAYMSPEQVLGKPTDARSSVFSLGILLYELVVGIPPFPVKTRSEAALYHSRESVAAPRSVRPDLPHGVERVILKALEKEPAARFQSAAELGNALAAAMNDVTEVVQLEGAQDGNLFQKYLASLEQPQRSVANNLTDAPDIGNTEVQPVFATERMDLPPKAQIMIHVSLEGRPPQTFAVEKATVTIGRDRENDLILDDSKISRRHAQVTWEGSNCYVTDLNSVNGTYLENVRLPAASPTAWSPHQALQIGSASLRLMSQGPSAFLPASLRSGPRTMAGEISDEPIVVTVTPQQLSVEAGESVTGSLSLLNQKIDTDTFSLSLTGIPNDWVSSLPTHVQLMPGEQQTTAFTLHIPRASQSRAGRHRITLRVASQTDPIQAVELNITLTIAAYSEFRAELQPPRLRAGQIGRITISNLGNIQETFAIRLTDTAGELVFEPPQIQMRIPEGRSAYAEFRSQESQVRILGGEKSHILSAHVSLPTSESQTLHAELLSKGLLPTWVLPITLLLFLFTIGAAAILLFWINRTATLTVLKNGDGVVTSSPGGIDCGPTCSFKFRNNRTITLVAAPLAPSTFAGWSGAGCSGTASCDVRIDSDQTVTAIFNPPGGQTLIVNTNGEGSGSVISSPDGINCGVTCAFAFAEGTTITLNAAAIPPATFGGWSGACSGTSPSCTVTMNTVQSVIATFNPPGKQTLTLTKSGTGLGSIISSPAGIDCGAVCSFDFEDGTTVTLTANPTAPSTFGGWSGGGCSGTSTTCTVLMNAAQSVIFTFNPPPNQTLTVTTTGTGTVTSQPAGINCGSTCVFDFALNATVTLTASPTAPFTFGGWSGGGCSGTSTSCTVVMNEAKTVTATFSPAGNQTLTINKSGNGAGTVTSSPNGISCGSTCTFSFPFNTPVTLTAAATPPYVFGGWGGACSGTAPTCIVTLSQAQTVTATFNLPGTQTLTVTKSGNGTGTVTSSPGIDCGSDCSESYPFNSTVSLTANPSTTSTFDGWSGACSGTASTCVVAMDQAKTVIAIFTQRQSQTLTVTIAGGGTGAVTSTPQGISCGAGTASVCTSGFAFNTSVTLTANPISPSTFSAWNGGGCSGALSTCTVPMNEARSVTATFNLPGPQTLTVTKGGTGTGTVTSNPNGISCGSDCSGSYQFDTTVTLTANPSTNTIFGGWGGACASSGTSLNCIVTMDQIRNATAAFHTKQSLTVKKEGPGAGTITSVPAAINCPTTCTADFADITNVTLTANFASPAIFGGWGGDCSSSGTSPTCTLAMNQAKTVTATFNVSPTQSPAPAGTPGTTSESLSPTRVSRDVPLFFRMFPFLLLDSTLKFSLAHKVTRTRRVLIYSPQKRRGE